MLACRAPTGLSDEVDHLGVDGTAFHTTKLVFHDC